MTDVATYLDDAEMVGENQEPPHVILRPYADAAAARAGSDGSPWVVWLDGSWRFAYADRPDGLPEGSAAEGRGSAGWNPVTVPHVWQQDGYDRPIYRNVPSEIAPYDPPRVPRDVNPTGVYVREFEAPDVWAGRRTFLRFEGVTGGFFVWLNGGYVGYDQGGYTPAEFDVTGLLRPGHNAVAVQVHRWSAGSYLENMDMWHLSGIFRSVWLYSTPQVRIRDVAVQTDFDADYRDAELRVAVELFRGDPGRPGAYQVRAALVDAGGTEVATLADQVDVRGARAEVTLTGTVPGPRKWSDEDPYRYMVVLELADPGGEVVHVVRQPVGFRKVEVKDRQILVNGVPVCLRGVNRHEHDPKTGRALSYKRMLEDVTLLKRNNINAVRASHYPNDPRWYDLADEMGLWIVDEVDVETHYRDKPPDRLADGPQWRRAMLDRFAGMVERDKNHPSVLMWSTGNEAGLGAAHFAMADYARRRDPTRLLYHQPDRGTGNGDAPYADVWGPRYPSPEDLEQIAARTDRPVVMGEWLHVLGNGLGHYEDMWRIIRREPALCGGFVWEWVGHELERPLVTTPDSSGNDITAYLVGNPTTVEGPSGRTALHLSGLDDWVEVERDPRLDLTGEALTVDAWVRPGEWTGDFTIVAKGGGYALAMRSPTVLTFRVSVDGAVAGEERVVAAEVADDWYDAWHRVTGTYDGVRLRLYVDGEQAAEGPCSERLIWSQYPVGVGRDVEVHHDKHAGRTAHGSIGRVRVYDTVLSAARLAARADPRSSAVLALDLDTFVERGTYGSYGTSPFLVDGIVRADRTPTPALAQMAYSHAPIRFADVAAARGRVLVASDLRFTDTSAIEIRWRLTEGSATVAAGVAHPRLAPGETAELSLPVSAEEAAGEAVERWLTLEAVLVEDTAWAEAGHVVAGDQFAAGGDRVPDPPVPVARTGSVSRGEVRVDSGDGTVAVSGDGFHYLLDRGTLCSMRVRGRELLAEGPGLDVWRAPLGNEWADWGSSQARLFWAVGLGRLQTVVHSMTAKHVESGSVRVSVGSFAAAPGRPGRDLGFAQTISYEIDAAGRVRLTHRIEPVGEEIRALPWLPRVGVRLMVPGSFDRFTWYGRGPGETYPDRKDAARVGVWNGTVDDQYVGYSPPQTEGNKTDVRWATLRDAEGNGLLVAGDGDAVNVAVSRYDDDDLDRAAYPFLLHRKEDVVLHVNPEVTGVGDTPNPTLRCYRVPADRVHEYAVTLRPLLPHGRRVPPPTINTREALDAD